MTSVAVPNERIDEIVDNVREQLYNEFGSVPTCVIQVGVNAKRGLTKAIARARRDRYERFSVVPFSIHPNLHQGRRMFADVRFILPEGSTESDAKRLAKAIGGKHGKVKTSKGTNTAELLSFNDSTPMSEVA